MKRPVIKNRGRKNQTDKVKGDSYLSWYYPLPSENLNPVGKLRPMASNVNANLSPCCLTQQFILLLPPNTHTLLLPLSSLITQASCSSILLTQAQPRPHSSHTVFSQRLPTILCTTQRQGGVTNHTLPHSAPVFFSPSITACMLTFQLWAGYWEGCHDNVSQVALCC